MHLENRVGLRRRLGSLILDIHPYTQDREITLPLLDLLLQNLHAMIELAEDEVAEQLKEMSAELRAVQDALLHPKDRFYALTKTMVKRLGELLRLYTSEVEDLENYWGMKSDMELEDRFADRVQDLIKDMREDLKKVQEMLPLIVSPTEACDTFYLLDQKIAQHIQELLATSTGKVPESEQTRNGTFGTAEHLYALARKIVERIDGMLEGVAPSIEEIKHARDIVADTEVEKTFPLLARKIVNDANAMLDGITPELEEVKVTEVVGSQVVYFITTVNPTILVGRVERFKRARREERGRFVGDVTLLLTEEQEEMRRLFYDLYILPKRTRRSSGLYVWPAELPQQTCSQTAVFNNRIELQWSLPLDTLLQKEAWEKAANIPEDGTIVQTITQAWRDGRIGRRVHYVKEDLWGYLEGIKVHADGSETWNMACMDDGQILTDESSQFWLIAGERRKGRL